MSRIQIVVLICITFILVGMEAGALGKGTEKQKEGDPLGSVTQNDENFTVYKAAIVTNPANQRAPDIWEDVVVWSDDRNGNWDIYGLNLATGKEFPICTHPADQFQPHIYGNTIIWRDDRNGGIYGKDLSTCEEFTVCTMPASWYKIYGDKVVWADMRNGNMDIFMKNLTTGEEIPICIAPGTQAHPYVYKDKVLWTDISSPVKNLDACVILANLFGIGRGDIYMKDLLTGQP